MTNDPNSPTIVKSFANDLEAAAFAAALEANGIQASTTGGYTAGFRAEAPGDVHVIVRQQDVEKAKQVLAKIDFEQGKVDWSQVDVGTPEDEEE